MTVQFSCSASVNNPCNTVSGVGITHGLISARKEREGEKKKERKTLGWDPSLFFRMERQDFLGRHFTLMPAFAGPPVSQAASFTSLCAGTEEGEEKSSDRGAGCPPDAALLARAQGYKSLGK